MQPDAKQKAVAFYTAAWPEFAATQWASPDIETFTGFEAERFLEPNFWVSRIHLEDRERVVGVLAGLREGEAFSVDYRWCCLGEDYRPFRDRGLLIPGTPPRVVGERESLARRAADREIARRLIAVIEASPDFAVLAEPDGSISYVNPVCRARFGVPPTEEVRFNLLEELPPESAESIREHFAQAREHGFWKGEDVVTLLDGTSLPVSEVVVAHRDDGGGLDFYSLLARDISAIKELESRLLQAKKMEAISLFAGRVAHDINNLLTVSLMCLDRIGIRIPRGGPGRFEFEELQKAFQGCQTLAGQLLTASLQEVEEAEDFDLREAVKHACRLIRSVLDPSIQLDIALAADPLIIHADRPQIELSLLNLLLNARDAMPEGGRIGITAEAGASCPPLTHCELSGSGRPAMVSVTDTGVGIPPDVLPHIFEPFFSTKPKGKGTGLGLTTVYASVKRANGAVCSSSQPGKGTRLTLCFPGRPAAAEPGRPASGGGCDLASDCRILVVDDEASILGAVRQALEDAGYRVTVAESGEEALTILAGADQLPALLLTDIVMPGMYGTDLAERVLDRHGETRILFMSGYTGQGVSLARFRSIGAELLRKPFGPEDLLKAVSLALKRRRPAAWVPECRATIGR